MNLAPTHQTFKPHRFLTDTQNPSLAQIFQTQKLRSNPRTTPHHHHGLNFRLLPSAPPKQRKKTRSPHHSVNTAETLTTAPLAPFPPSAASAGHGPRHAQRHAALRNSVLTSPLCSISIYIYLLHHHHPRISHRTEKFVQRKKGRENRERERDAPRRSCAPGRCSGAAARLLFLLQKILYLQRRN